MPVGFRTKRETLMPGSCQILRIPGVSSGLAQGGPAFCRVLPGRISPLSWVVGFFVCFCFSFPPEDSHTTGKLQKGLEEGGQGDNLEAPFSWVSHTPAIRFFCPLEIDLCHRSTPPEAAAASSGTCEKSRGGWRAHEELPGSR